MITVFPRQVFAVCLVGFLVVSPPHVASAEQPQSEIRSIVDLFDNDAPLKISQVPYTRKESTPIQSRFFANEAMRRIELRMTSQVYRDLECEHDVTIYLPKRKLPKETQGAAAIILGGKEIRVEDAKLDWLESIVLGLSIPCVVVEQAFDAKKFGARNPGELMSFGDQRYRESGDPREAGYYALAKIFSAAATVAENLPELRASRFVVTGSSKGGMAALIACAGDRRIVGAFPTAWNAGDVLGFTKLKGERWGWNVKPKQTGPAGQTARQSMTMMDSPRGRKYRTLFDPAEWNDLLQGKFIMPAVGTNDPLFHLLSDSNYFDQWKCQKAFLRVPNYGHGRKHAQHALGWQTAVAATLLGRKIPTIRLVTQREGEQVTLTAHVGDHRGDLELVLWQTKDATGDYRRAKWTRSKSIKLDGKSNHVRIAQVSAPKTGTAAFFMQLRDSSSEPSFINSSNVVELGMPVIRKQESDE
ncbi:MAG: PhoPQ-activated protein PqaA family protein [Rubripirellula sp.]|nr:PhoPQ-activated protein PqaA family protein [Rubripirellula sp.]